MIKYLTVWSKRYYADGLGLPGNCDCHDTR